MCSLHFSSDVAERERIEGEREREKVREKEEVEDTKTEAGHIPGPSQQVVSKLPPFVRCLRADERSRGDNW